MGLESILNKNFKYVEGDDNVRVAKCLQAIKEVMEKFDCVLMPQIVISGNNIQSMVKVVPKPRTTEPN